MAAVVAVVATVLASLWTLPLGYGRDDWDQMEAHRYFVWKSLRVYGQFPFWDPYGCGGHAWWAGPESGTTIVPWLPIYALFSLPVAMRLEVSTVVIAGAVGTWLLAGRFTTSPGARLLVVCAFVLNGRFAMQLAVGHVWHLYYAGLPWALFFFDRAVTREDDPFGDLVGLAVTLALLVYTGAIYPLPQTVLVLGLAALIVAGALRSWQPLVVLAVAGVGALGLAAPRLLPLAHEIGQHPRLVASDENLDLPRLVALFTTRAGHPHPEVSPWGWHEFGIYIGWVPFLLLLVPIFTFRTTRERMLLYPGLVCLLLGLGRFSSFSPWALLHDYAPVFRSQHVPTRWLFPAVLLLLTATAAIAERWLSTRAWRSKAEVGVLLLAAAVSLDVALQSRQVLHGTLSRLAPTVAPHDEFHQEAAVPRELEWSEPDWMPPNLPAMMANVGLLQCVTFYADTFGPRGAHAWVLQRGPASPAHGEGDPAYRGEAYLAERSGEARITRWSPREVTVDYTTARADLLVLNQRWDEGWQATGHEVVSEEGLVGAHVDAGSGEVTFRYRPPRLGLGLGLLALTVAAGAGYRFRRASSKAR